MIHEYGYEHLYRCCECDWTTTRYAEIDGHEDQLEPGHLVTGEVEQGDHVVTEEDGK